jgi:ABC-type uncharacterized transport system permease subunit
LEKFEWETLLHLVGVTAGLFCFLLWFWGIALRNYSSASS